MAAPEVSDLNGISQKIGIDLEALRSKWSNAASGAVANAATHPKTPASSERGAAVDTDAVLDQYTVCTGCHGTGLQRSIYNFISMERNCPDCGGEGLIKPDLASVVAENGRIIAELEGLPSVAPGTSETNPNPNPNPNTNPNPNPETATTTAATVGSNGEK